MNVADLAAFARVHLQGLAGVDTVVRAESVQTLYRALGYYQRESEQIGYVGSAGTFYAILALRPARQLAVVLMTNAGDGGNIMAEQVLDRVLSAVMA